MKQYQCAKLLLLMLIVATITACSEFSEVSPIKATTSTPQARTSLINSSDHPDTNSPSLPLTFPEVIWGSPHITEETTREYGKVFWVDELNPRVEQYGFYSSDQSFAVYIEITADSEKSCEDYFAGLGWEILPMENCRNQPNPKTTHTLLVTATHKQLWAIKIEDVAAYFECPPVELTVTFFQAVKAS